MPLLSNTKDLRSEVMSSLRYHLSVTLPEELGVISALIMNVFGYAQEENAGFEVSAAPETANVDVGTLIRT
jgi:hypothetical protein